MAGNILVIDDSRAVRALLSDASKQSGYNVLTATDGDDGIAKYQAEQPDLVITDLNMPNGNGIDVIKRLRSSAESKFVPILVFTAEGPNSRKEEARLAGATGWLKKPLRKASLLAILRRLTGQ